MDNPTQQISYRLGTHRIYAPEETLSRVMPLMSSMGITRVADVTGLDTINIPVVMVCRPNSRSVSVSQGKGSTIAAAKASGLMESVEGYHAENIDLPLRIASKHDMERMGKAVSTELLPTVDSSPFDKHYPITWIESEDIHGGCSYWIPYEMVHTNYTHPRPTGSGCFPASSNGLASGNTVEEATCHAICEVLERDALSVWHQSSAAYISSTSIDPNTIDDALCNETLCKLQSAGQESYIWDITSNTNVPSYMCVVIDSNSHTRHIGVGSGTHLSRGIALVRALHEAVQVRTTYIVGARDDITPDEYTPEGIESKRKYFGEMVAKSSFTSSYARTSDIDSNSVLEDQKTLLENIKLLGLSQVLRVDLTKPEFGIPVVRVVIPGLEPPHDEEGYIAGPRAQLAFRGVAS